MGRGAYAKALGQCFRLTDFRKGSSPNHVPVKYLRITKGAVEFKNFCESDAKVKPASKRGQISTFSRGSRKRMIIRALNLQTAPDCWQTLTCADDTMDGLSLGRRARFSSDCMKDFKRSVSTAYPGISGLWRREWEPRKSGSLKGQLVPHFHILWILPNLNRSKYTLVMQHIAKLWVECTGTSSLKALEVAQHPKSYEILDGSQMIVGYVGKYMAKTSPVETKTDEVSNDNSLGRMWGEIGKVEYVPFLDRNYGPLQAVWIKRMFKRLIKSKASVAPAKKGKGKRVKRMLNLIAGESTWLILGSVTTLKIIGFVDSLGLPPF